ncbi:MAG: DUF362 domain-containing protein [Clostridia bacterium]|nr:DUF362 domain-containing protein [Clostridia bacterium]MBQ2091615.1 DUF362 domain-containing protein [Clostridia bacterium]MBQ2500750.1 DUF362 domain-containing protein [Clostridia bacterium]MBQ3897608.1 DUF362 domain-containing protein [Clostridia bacterium]
MKSKVYFTKEVDSAATIKLYEAVGKKLTGNIAFKIHSGEDGNQNFLRPTFWKPLADHVGVDTVVECNTAYPGERNSTEKHLKLIDKHEWTKYFKVDIMDAEGPDMVLPVEPGNILEKNYVGKNLKNYDACLIAGHFKGHPAGGYGGALKQLSIGFASTVGKCLIHSAGEYDDQDVVWNHMASNEDFTECMADAAKSVVDYFGGNAVYIFAMKNLSVDCDCCNIAEDPCMKDIGILASTDPVALDKACLDLVWASDDPGRDHLIERIESRQGRHIIEAAERIGVGSSEYELIEI